MTRKELAVELATLVKEANNLTTSVKNLANGYLKGIGAIKPYTKSQLVEAIKLYK